MIPRRLLASALALALSFSAHGADDHALAPAPPLGWNSWDIFGTTITEAQARRQADVMAARLLPHGWNTFVVDIQWYQPTANGHDYEKGAALAMDAYSRLLPAPQKFPSAADGQGFKPLADYVHAKGLKFGIHMMRGIPRQAVERNTALLGTDARAADIADRDSVCAWNPDMFGVDMRKPGAQAYYDSLLYGGDMTRMDPFTLSLLTNDEVLAVNQRSANNRQLFRTDDGMIAWVADVPGSADKYLAVFNTRDATGTPGGTAPVRVALADLGFAGGAGVRDLWRARDLGKVRDALVADVPFHGARLYRIER